MILAHYHVKPMKYQEFASIITRSKMTGSVWSVLKAGCVGFHSYLPR